MVEADASDAGPDETVPVRRLELSLRAFITFSVDTGAKVTPEPELPTAEEALPLRDVVVELVSECDDDDAGG